MYSTLNTCTVCFIIYFILNQRSIVTYTIYVCDAYIPCILVLVCKTKFRHAKEVGGGEPWFPLLSLRLHTFAIVQEVRLVDAVSVLPL